jgi:hypothetical protein
MLLPSSLHPGHGGTTRYPDLENHDFEFRRLENLKSCILKGDESIYSYNLMLTLAKRVI